MSRGKAEFLRSLKEAVAQRRKAQAEERVAADYLTRWSKGLGKDGYDHALFQGFLNRLKKRYEVDQSNCNHEIGKLFADCELSLSDQADKELLLAALAHTIYPQPAGAKQKWDAKSYDELWHDILLVKQEYDNTEAAKVGTSYKELSSQAIAEKLVRSKKFSTKYRSKKKGVEEKIDPDNLRKRVSAAMDARLDHNPNLRIFDFDYILRANPEKGPPCAAGLSFQPALPRGSAAAEQAASIEKELFAEAQAFFEALGLFMTDRSKCACRGAARRIARRRVRQSLEGL